MRQKIDVLTEEDFLSLYGKSAFAVLEEGCEPPPPGFVRTEYSGFIRILNNSREIIWPIVKGRKAGTFNVYVMDRARKVPGFAAISPYSQGTVYAFAVERHVGCIIAHEHFEYKPAGVYHRLVQYLGFVCLGASRPPSGIVDSFKAAESISSLLEFKFVAFPENYRQ